MAGDAHTVPGPRAEWLLVFLLPHSEITLIHGHPRRVLRLRFIHPTRRLTRLRRIVSPLVDRLERHMRRRIVTVRVDLNLATQVQLRGAPTQQIDEITSDAGQDILTGLILAVRRSRHRKQSRLLIRLAGLQRGENVLRDRAGFSATLPRPRLGSLRLESPEIERRRLGRLRLRARLGLHWCGHDVILPGSVVMSECLTFSSDGTANRWRIPAKCAAVRTAVQDQSERHPSRSSTRREDTTSTPPP